MTIPPVDTAILRERTATKSACSNLGYGPYGIFQGHFQIVIYTHNRISYWRAES